MVMMMPFFMGVTMFTAVVMAFLTVVRTAHFMLFFMIVTAAVVFFIVILMLAAAMFRAMMMTTAAGFSAWSAS